MPIGNILPSKGVIRCLFGPVDHEQRKKELSRLSKALDQRNCQKWNFDFKLGAPFSGKYSWEEVVANEQVPQAYEMANLETVRRFSRVTICPKSEENTESVCVPAAKSSLVTTPELSNETQVNISRPSTPVKSRKRRRETDDQLSQRLITDYYRSVKSDILVAKRRKMQL